MPESLIIILVLLSVIFIQQVYYLRQIQKLVDKLMSRSYTEYVRAEKPFERPKIASDEPLEDLRTLQEFSQI